MPYANCKIYSDGSHYIAIPHTTRPFKPRKKPKEEPIAVPEETEERKLTETSVSSVEDAPFPLAEENDNGSAVCKEKTETFAEKPCMKRQTTRRELFDEFYAKYRGLPRYKRQAAIFRRMRTYFKDADSARLYVEIHMRRKIRSLIARRVRMMRKVNLQTFNYFVTFTYSDELHTEESFREKLKSCLSRFCTRKGWKYIGVWERSPEKKRLHFHGVFYIPEGTMPGILFEKNDYNFNTHSRQITHQNTYFNEHFGRSDFEPIEGRMISAAVAYIVKYLEKTGEKIVYSKGLPQFFITDVREEDVVCPFGQENKKLLLYDDFQCVENGISLGSVSKEVISKMRKRN